MMGPGMGPGAIIATREAEARNYSQTCKQDEVEEGWPPPHGSAAYAHDNVMQLFFRK
ncbi:hypothetical protein [Parasphingorhabdus cellanae]|uniref:Uncharacterized protein n=1 Tax=Parasphingorhabdus cellanae TaxID=2806553 RepID=A0ABX7T159_9SPHN|nr:hypothetical protein [Parasphingorhabdus cellanae]QTD54502.1 hypothetical protein J4G78_09365 [Parasphingorhabdus cellanae]